MMFLAKQEMTCGLNNGWLSFVDISDVELPKETDNNKSLGGRGLHWSECL